MPPTPPEWTLNASGLTGGSNASKLAGCHFTTNSAGTAYEFTEPNLTKKKYTVGPPLPSSGTTMTFGPFNFNGVDGWTLTATAPLTAGSNFTGQWNTPDTLGLENPIPDLQNTPAQSGTYTATADATRVEEAAAHAKA